MYSSSPAGSWWIVVGAVQSYRQINRPTVPGNQSSVPVETGDLAKATGTVRQVCGCMRNAILHGASPSQTSGFSTR